MLNDARQAVETMIISGVSLSEIEDCIERQPLDSEDRTALWLLAWARRSRHREHAR